MALRRGFKSEAAALALEVRTELGLGQLDRLDPRQLAQHLDIPIVGLSELATTLHAAQYFLSEDQSAFSAGTVFDGHRRMIVHNDCHSEARQNSNLAHELAHPLLFHEPTLALDLITGCRHWNDDNEDEANWLGGELLVTTDMALAVARGHLSQPEAQERWGVSYTMLKWRLNARGAAKRVQRERARRGTNRKHAGPNSGSSPTR